jgi:hypothetical protein
MSLPSAVGLPAEMQLGSLDYSLPSDAKSFSVRVQPSNLSQIASASQSLTASTTFDNISFPSQSIIFDIPAGSSPSTFLDNRMTTLNFRATTTTAAGSSSAVMTSAYLRSHANAFFDRMYIVAQNGNIIEDITEYGFVNDTLIALQMSNSVRDGVANQFGFLSSASAIDNQGHAIGILNNRTLATTAESEVHSYSIPLLSGVAGVLADKMLNIGRTSRLQIVLVTTNQLPYTIVSSTATTAGSFSVTLSDFSLGLEYIDVGLNALQMLDQTLADGKAYIHGTSYRTATATIPAGTSGTQSLLVGVRASSVKSLFSRFFDGGSASTTNSINGKYDSKNPVLNSVNWSIGGIKFPQSAVNPLLNPAQAFRETQMAVGSWNNYLFTSGITPVNYCKLAAGGTAAGTTSTTTDYNYTLSSSATAQAQFIFGVNTEVVMRRGLLSGYNCTAAPIFLECNIGAALTNSNTLYGIAMIDTILIHDVRSGDIQVRV